MSKKGRKVRRWHHARIEQEYGRSPHIVIREMFEYGVPLTVMAGALHISYGEMHEWVRELGVSRPSIERDNPYPTRRRIEEQFGYDAVALICADRKMGMSYAEIKQRYGVSSGFVAQCLHEGASWLIGDPIFPVTVRAPQIDKEERARMSCRCIEHNLQMKRDGTGWFKDMDKFFR